MDQITERIEECSGIIYYVHKIFRKTNISYPLLRTGTCAYQWVRNVGFSKNFVYVLNEWSLTIDLTIHNEASYVFVTQSLETVTVNCNWSKNKPIHLCYGIFALTEKL